MADQNGKDALRQHQKRTGIITALGTAYTSISLVDLKKNTVEIVKNASDTVKKQKHFALKRSVQQEQIEKIIAEPSREEYLAFTDMTTVAERLKGHTSLALTSQTVDRKWILTLITPQRKDADGNVTAVLLLPATLPRKSGGSKSRRMPCAMHWRRRNTPIRPRRYS